ncbi:MAG TPA: glycine cleavage system protein GcvH [Candidatus Limnocylindria bacterium]|nr:glycine cleavage system protein GcvH [Candidatus Limnocylindria bacterium]
MSRVPDDLRYSKEHEWVRVDGDTATVGITAFAQEQLGDVVFVELPEKGARVRQHASLGVVESVKAASDVYAPISGEVLERNVKVIESPELVNAQPYGDGWMVKVRVADKGELGSLLSPGDYRSHIGEESAAAGD